MWPGVFFSFLKNREQEQSILDTVFLSTRTERKGRGGARYNCMYPTVVKVLYPAINQRSFHGQLIPPLSPYIYISLSKLYPIDEVSTNESASGNVGTHYFCGLPGCK